MKQITTGYIRIELERKPIKNMYLRVTETPDRVRVSAPVYMSEQEICRFVASKQDWILKQQERLVKRKNNIINYEEDDMVSIWGRYYRLVICRAVRHDGIQIIGDEVRLFCKADSSKEQRKNILDRWYREVLAGEIPSLFARWETKIGVKAHSWNIRDMKTRWGSCNIRTKIICLNLQLAKKPPKCLEYVVVHELVHLLEGSHNHVFKTYMDHFLPQWRCLKKELNGMV